MRYVKPHFYDSFVCTAGDCPDTCCAGWQIMIDEESLERYENEPGEFGKILRNSIDWEEECFYQNVRIPPEQIRLQRDTSYHKQHLRSLAVYLALNTQIHDKSIFRRQPQQYCFHQSVPPAFYTLHRL